MPNSVIKINREVFRSCRNLKEIELSEKIEIIGQNAFYCCAIEKIDIPSSIKYINSNAFTFCFNLKEIAIKSKCKICNDIFKACSNLEKIYITKKSFNISPDFVKEYGDKIELINKTLDELLNEGKSFHEINKLMENNEIII